MAAKNLALILARAGSKGVTNKNLTQIGGHSLIDWAYFAACEANSVDMIMLSTDYEARHFAHLDVVFRSRPDALCSDRASSYDAILDSLDFLAGRGDDIETITLLEPPCPFRNGELIDEVVRFHRETGASSVVTLKPVDDAHPVRMRKVGEMGRLSAINDAFVEPINGLPRQMQETFYVRDTAVYVLDAAHLKSRGDGLYGPDPRGVVNPAFTCNIDNQIDLLTAKAAYDAYCENKWDLQVPERIKNEKRLHSD